MIHLSSMKKLILVFISIFPSLFFSQTKSPLYVNSEQISWVDSIYNKMSLDEKIGQLFMVAAYSNKGKAHEDKIKNLIKNQQIGGLIFMQDNANKQADLTNEYQNLSKYPLLIGMDAEWDLSMRLKNTNKFPWAMTLGAVKNEELIYSVGEKIANHLNAIGAHFNFAPVADVNVNPLNPIIGNRSFGSNPENVAQKGYLYAKGMQDNNILASAKHFPGHGDTSKDSHKTLPVIPHTKDRLNKTELYPFQKLIDNGITSIMTSHLSVPALEPTKNLPATLSKKIITDLLKKEMGFKGIIITDALNMKGVTKFYPNGLTDYMAFEAGNDILLFSQAVATGKAKIKAGINSGKIPLSRLEESVKKILMAKYFVGLNKIIPVDKTYLKEDLNDNKSKAITQQIFEEAATLLKNENKLIPIKDIQNKKFAWIGLEEGKKDEFYTYLQKYVKVDKINPKNYLDKASNYDYVFISVHKSNASPYKSYKISANSLKIINEISKKSNVIISIFASPYSLKSINNQNIKAIFMAYQNHEFAKMAVPQIIFGAIDAKGNLPVDVNKTYKFGDGIYTKSINRLGYTLPENVGISSDILKNIDDIAQSAIRMRASPGMQVLAARNGKVFWDKTYGNKDYKSKEKVKWNDLYDVASITKTIATLPLLMKEYEKKQFNIFSPLKNLIPQASLSNKSDITNQEILAHQSGLYPWIPFYKETIDSLTLKPSQKLYRTSLQKNYTTQVANNLYIIDSYKDSIINKILLKENNSKSHEYSDLGYYLYKYYLENKYQKGLDKLANANFFEPLGMNYTTYNPLKKFNISKIAPTENDIIYRNQLIRGYVHDQGAAMEGGIGGHAGVFANANDLAKIYQMYLNGGTYGGKKYFDNNTINYFTAYQFIESDNRRGLGFDKQLEDKGPSFNGISTQSFGHTGFTGTIAWADPEQKIVYIFLSNRVHPNADNRKLIQHDIRPKIHEEIYNAITERY